jgi:hypothetical protein
MMELTIHVTGLEKLADAIISLAGTKISPAVQGTVPVSGASAGAAQPIPANLPQSAPPAFVPQSPSVPVSAPGMVPSGSGMPMPAQVPTSIVPQEYTQDQIAVAMTGLSDQGRGAELINILARFGASSLVQVPKERYPELVLILREAGAAI